MNMTREEAKAAGWTIWPLFRTSDDGKHNGCAFRGEFDEFRVTTKADTADKAEAAVLAAVTAIERYPALLKDAVQFIQAIKACRDARDEHDAVVHFLSQNLALATAPPNKDPGASP